MITPSTKFFESTDLHIERHRPFLSFSGLELDRVPFVKIFQLGARRETSSMEEDIFTAVVGDDKTESLLPDDFLYRSCHLYLLLSKFRPAPAILDFSQATT
jgi:hypothetical protein